jgi:small subunit ribosomal protein S16
VATKIKLMRLGKMRAPYYRIVIADARNKRDGRSIETIGKYHPKEDPSFIEVDSERAQYWLGVGAQPTEAVAAILRVTGDWQKFKGLPAPAPMLVAAPKSDKHAAFADAAAAAAGIEESTGGSATTPKAKKTPKKADASAADAPAADAPAADAPAADAPAAPAAEAPAAPTPSDEPAVAVATEDTPAADETAAAEASAAAATTTGA